MKNYNYFHKERLDAEKNMMGRYYPNVELHIEDKIYWEITMELKGNIKIFRIIYPERYPFEQPNIAYINNGKENSICFLIDNWIPDKCNAVMFLSQIGNWFTQNSNI